MADKRIIDLTEDLTPDFDNDNGAFDSTSEGTRRSPLRNMTRRSGLFDYNDAETAVTPISITASTWTKLTNNALGPYTNNSYPPPGVTSVWSSSTNQFDWTQLNLGDQVAIRFDLNVTTTTPSQEIQMRMQFGIGFSTYDIKFVQKTVKSASTFQIVTFEGFYMGNLQTRDYPAEIQFWSDASASVVVNGFYINVTRY